MPPSPPFTEPPFNIFRSWRSDCWGGDLHRALEVYSEEELAAIASHGFTGIWLHQPLADYTPSRRFPSFGQQSATHLATLRELIARAARHGLDLWLYLLEPRARLKDDPFWDDHPELRGQYWKQPIYEREYYALCSETEEVQQWLSESLTLLCRELPGLGGFIAITAAEDFSTCVGKLWEKEHFERVFPGASRTAMEEEVNCPRCRDRESGAIVAQLLNTMHAAIREGNSQCRLLAWDWGWDHLPGEEVAITRRLSPEIIRLSDFEIGGERKIMGRPCPVHEYSLGYSGPSPRFKERWDHSEQEGAPVAAKLQVGTTHELASVPNLPLLHSLYRKLQWLTRHRPAGVLATWNMGNMRTLNTWAFGQGLRCREALTYERFYHGIVGSYLRLSPAQVDRMVEAWSAFERGFESYPYSTHFIYRSPLNYALAYWLDPGPIKGIATSMSCDVLVHGDDLSLVLGPFTLEEVMEGFGQLASHWEEGVAIYLGVLEQSPSQYLLEETNTARCALALFQSMERIFRLYRLCLEWDEATSLQPYRELCEQELVHLRTVLPLLESDSRLGFHSEAQSYLFSPTQVGAKISRLENLTLAVI